MEKRDSIFCRSVVSDSIFLPYDFFTSTPEKTAGISGFPQQAKKHRKKRCFFMAEREGFEPSVGY